MMGEFDAGDGLGKDGGGVGKDGGGVGVVEPMHTPLFQVQPVFPGDWHVTMSRPAQLEPPDGGDGETPPLGLSWHVGGPPSEDCWHRGCGHANGENVLQAGSLDGVEAERNDSLDAHVNSVNAFESSSRVVMGVFHVDGHSGVPRISWQTPTVLFSR